MNGQTKIRYRNVDMSYDSNYMDRHISRNARRSIEGFISHELTEQGWFSTDEDNAQVAADITRLLVVVDYCTDRSQLFHVMFSESQTQTDFARDVSIKFLSLDPAPDDPALRSFVRRIFTFYLETSWSHEEEDWKEYLKSNGITPLDPALRVDCPASNDSSLKPDQPENEPAEIENKPVVRLNGIHPFTKI